MMQRSDLAERVANYSRRARQLQKLSAGRRRLRRGAAYASAAGAAVAAATAAEATIVWSGSQNRTIQINGNASFTSTNTGLNTGAAPIPVLMSLSRAAYITSGGVVVYQSARFDTMVAPSFRFAGGNGSGAAVKFASGANITATQFAQFGAILANHNGGLNFANGETAFLGFSFTGNKGWIKVRWDDEDPILDGRPDKLTAFEWAYEDSGGPIAAGQTVAVPEPAATALMSLVACGCAGVMALKKLRRAG